MRLLLIVLLALLASAGLALLVQGNTGQVLITRDDAVIETSLTVFAAIVIVAFIVFYLLVRLLAHLWRTPGWLSGLGRRGRANKARKKLNKGLVELAEGHWSKAEGYLTQSAPDSELPWINYVAAARAAQMQGEHKRRDDHLQQAYRSEPDADMAVGLAKAELQIAQGQTEQALATLDMLRERAPKHAYVLKLQGKLYHRLKDWKHLAGIVPELRKARVIAPERILEYERASAESLMTIAVAKADAKGLKALWKQLPKGSRENPELILAYAGQLQQIGDGGDAEAVLRDALDREWDERLARQYGVVESGNDSRQLKAIENWLKRHERSPMLLLSAGRLCRRMKLWGKARSYLESSLGIKPSPETYRALARLLEQHGDHEEAGACYRKGLILAVDGLVHPEPEPAPVELAPDREPADAIPFGESAYPV